MPKSYFRGMTAVFFFTVTFISTFAAAQAQDLSLIIGNKTYRNAGWMYEAETALASGRALRNNGFTVISGRDMDALRSRQALEEFLARMPQARHVVVMLSGHFVHSARETWFLAVDTDTPNITTVGFDGISVNTLLELVGQKPGGASVFLGTFARRIDLGVGLTAGIGRLDIPQGVFVATGQPEDIDQTLRRDFLADGAGIADALANAPDSVQGFGFVSNFATIRSGAARRPVVDEADVLEQGYWQATVELGTTMAMGNYLNRYPKGAFASQAQDWIKNQAARSPEELAKAAEAAMNLTRGERRKVQENLTILGFSTRGVDGVFGRGTRGAIENWQSSRGFTKSGYLKPAQVIRLANQAEVKRAKLAEEERKRQEDLERADAAFWGSSGAAAGREKGLKRYLKRYPDGVFSDLAKSRLQVIREEKRRNAAAADQSAWGVAEAANDIAAYEKYLADFADGAFVDEANARLEVLRNDTADAATVEAARLNEQNLRMNIIAKILVESRLNALGLNAGSEDGIFTLQTREALRAFQRARQFPVTGYLTRQTLMRMIAETGG